MNEPEFRTVLPFVAGWIRRTLAEHAAEARTVTSFGFGRLPDYYSAQLLSSSKVVVVPRVPVPPLSVMGLARFAELERMDLAGITYLDTYFVRAGQAAVESLHFHELVHVIQWQLLGLERFLALYAAGLERLGYRKSPLEMMAYDLQDRFEREPRPFSVETVCQPMIRAITSQGGGPASLAR